MNFIAQFVPALAIGDSFIWLLCLFVILPPMWVLVLLLFVGLFVVVVVVFEHFFTF